MCERESESVRKKIKVSEKEKVYMGERKKGKLNGERERKSV